MENNNIWTIAILTLIIGVAMYFIFDTKFKNELHKVGVEFVPLVEQETLKLDTVISDFDHEEECNTGEQYDVYELREKFFKKDEVLNIRTVVHYFSNGENTMIEDSIFYKRVGQMSEFYKNSNANINFVLDRIMYYNGRPTDNKEILKSIEGLESIFKEKRTDLRDYYYGQHVDLHNTFLEVPNALNIYVYNDKTGFSGRAGEIESNYFAVSLKYMRPDLYTFEHEVGHCLGLLHTHQFDNSGKTNSIDGGDKICDTYVTFPLSDIVSVDCKLEDNWRNLVKLTPYSNPISSWDSIEEHEIEQLIINVMSYTRHTCRKEFVSEQVRRMRKMLENNKDLRKMIIGLDFNIKKELIKNLAEIKVRNEDTK